MTVDGYTQLATYWGPPVIDGYGNRSFTSPVNLYVRWEDHIDLIINDKGEEIPSQARIFVLQDVVVGGYIALGNQVSAYATNPQDLQSAYLIKQYYKTVSIDGREITRKVIV